MEEVVAGLLLVGVGRQAEELLAAARQVAAALAVVQLAEAVQLGQMAARSPSPSTAGCWKTPRTEWGTTCPHRR